MQQFVIIFRRGTTPPSEVEIQKGAAETRAWAQIQNAAGHQLAPHILTPESHSLHADGSVEVATALSPGSLTALLFLQADDFVQAVEVARAHPALRYGSLIEVRAWTAPVVPT